MLSHYSTLGLTRQSSTNEVRTAYILKCKQYHPDHGGDNTEFCKLNDAYLVLRNPVARKKYNAWLDDTYPVCTVCTGQGVVLKQRSFTQRTIGPCLDCRGAGVQ